MKLFNKINLFFWRIDGIFCLLGAVVTFLALMQCMLGVQSGVTVLAVPCFVLIMVCFLCLTRFFDWLLMINRRTRLKIVKRKVNTILDTWGMEKYNETK